eukprot:gene10711-biopygen2260
MISRQRCQRFGEPKQQATNCKAGAKLPTAKLAAKLPVAAKLAAATPWRYSLAAKWRSSALPAAASMPVAAKLTVTVPGTWHGGNAEAK